MSETSAEARRSRRRAAPSDDNEGAEVAAAAVDVPLGAPQNISDEEVAEELRHKRGCPATTDELGEPGSRVEVYTQDVPPYRWHENGGRRITRVVRCVKCGEQVEAINL